MDEEMVEAAASALRDERIVMGESVFRFEEEFARYIGVRRAVSVSSGTDALILALIALGVKGREVITTPFTFIATANSVVHACGEPRFADVDPMDGNIDPEVVIKAAGGRTAAMMPVHIFGQPARMSELMDIARDKGLMVVEDAAQAHGSQVGGKMVGSIGDLGCFSFYPTKNMNVGGDGGMVTTDDDDLADMVAKLRDCGRTGQYEHDVCGFTSRLNTVNAAIGRVQLRRLDSWNEARRRLARRYIAGLEGVDGLETPAFDARGTMSVFHQFVVRSDRRDALAAHLAERDISTAIHYPLPVHLQPAYSWMGLAEGDFPIAEALSRTSLSLPMCPNITENEVDRIVEAVRGFLDG